MSFMPTMMTSGGGGPRPRARQQSRALSGGENPYLSQLTRASGPAQTPNTSSWLFSMAPEYADSSTLDIKLGGGPMVGGNRSLNEAQAEADRVRNLRTGRV